MHFKLSHFLSLELSSGICCPYSRAGANPRHINLYWPGHHMLDRDFLHAEYKLNTAGYGDVDLSWDRSIIPFTDEEVKRTLKEGEPPVLSAKTQLAMKSQQVLTEVEELADDLQHVILPLGIALSSSKSVSKVIFKVERSWATLSCKSREIFRRSFSWALISS